jgi:hypothetical protein
MEKNSTTMASREYIDKLDKGLASDLELIAYATQIGDAFTPHDLKLDLINYVGREYRIPFVHLDNDFPRLVNTSDETESSSPHETGPEHGAIGKSTVLAFPSLKPERIYRHGDGFFWTGHRHRPIPSIYGSVGVRSYSQFLGQIFVPRIRELFDQDEHELLSQFVFGFMASLQWLHPTIYFVNDLAELRQKRIGLCFANPGPDPPDLENPVEDTVVVPTDEIQKLNSCSDQRLLQFLLDDQYLDVNVYLFIHAVRRLWFGMVSNRCPCGYTKHEISSCRLQSELYRAIRRYMLSRDGAARQGARKGCVLAPEIYTYAKDDKNTVLRLHDALPLDSVIVSHRTAKKSI